MYLIIFMNKFLIILFFTTIFSLQIKAQSVSGTLHDLSGNNPVSNATVQFAKDSISNPLITVSSSKGFFTFNNVANGNYTLTITSIGYKVFEKQVSVNGQGIDLGIR